MKIRPEEALEYHSSTPAGKLSLTPAKPCRTQRDLSLAMCAQILSSLPSSLP